MESWFAKLRRIDIIQLFFNPKLDPKKIVSIFNEKSSQVWISNVSKSMLNTRFCEVWGVQSADYKRASHTRPRWKARGNEGPLFKGALQSNRRRLRAKRPSSGRQNIQTLRTRSRRTRNIIMAFATQVVAGMLFTGRYLVALKRALLSAAFRLRIQRQKSGVGGCYLGRARERILARKGIFRDWNNNA